MKRTHYLKTGREMRHDRVRGKVQGSPERPRLNVFRSNNHIYAQVIDDSNGHTLAAANSLEPALRDEAAKQTGVEQAKLVGKTVAQRAKEKGIGKVVFDRGGYLYHGRVKALADAAREGGLDF
ncbi:MAG: 50S ribosomal protein L18 [Candidatus Chloroheliales bacterium]|nr:MAG: 50S ribosomal protein L18 [Chloroflexota bacterium]